ncbi:MAG: RNA polymerase sigma factor [Clostridia bacterium]|jgi:RNA polymerase sigma-70 factor (ECF subfamily)
MYTKEELKAQIHKIIDNNISMIYRISFQNVKNKEAAEDIVQEAFIKLLETEKTFNDEEHIKAWLITVTINLCRDYYRNNIRHKIVPIEGVVINNGDGISDEYIDLLNALYSLRKNYSLILYLYYYEEYTIQEIANMMNKTKSTINTWLRRARSELSEILTKDGRYSK